MANSLTTSNGLNLRVGMTFDTQKARQDLTASLKDLEHKSTIQTTVVIDKERFVKTIRTYQDSMKNLVKETTLWNGAGKTMKTTITELTTAEERVNKALDEQTRRTKELSEAQNRLNNNAQKSINIFQDFTSTFAKMVKFNTINLIYDAIVEKMSETIEITNDFNAAMTEFKKVTDTSGLSLKDYTKELGQLGETVGYSATKMLEASTEFSKSGFSPENSAKLAQVALTYTNIADAEISAGEAASFIISQMKAFNIEAEDAMSILDKVNEVKLFVTS